MGILQFRGETLAVAFPYVPYYLLIKCALTEQ
jgi:hypothetical protein